jgi:CYTH domain-containing protein
MVYQHIQQYKILKQEDFFMEIERKYLISQPPADYTAYPYHLIEQGYLSTEPVVRIRREDEFFYLTYKSKGLLEREEYNLPLTPESYEHLIKKADGHILTKKRYLIPLEGSDHLTIELDVFEGRFKGLILAEVEFPKREEAERFTPPSWFGEDVTFSGEYQNSRLSQLP